MDTIQPTQEAYEELQQLFEDGSTKLAEQLEEYASLPVIPDEFIETVFQKPFLVNYQMVALDPTFWGEHGQDELYGCRAHAKHTADRSNWMHLLEIYLTVCGVADPIFKQFVDAGYKDPYEILAVTKTLHRSIGATI